ncbi:hypothetical protein A4A49_37653 [Nicotiana attenuata]|uniref:RNase H type-1 domain-containing protein n=1 Tax=Nicotiana attenuata TaxID=49451 RepID=A0A1J6KWV8_NICAT|nr:hypothetical protein A4A49_37653 [Nicotiana attenuata]
MIFQSMEILLHPIMHILTKNQPFPPMESTPNDHLHKNSNTKLARDGVPAGQVENAGYQNDRPNEDISLAPSILYGYQSTASILQSLNPGTQNSSKVQKKNKSQHGPIEPKPLIENPSSYSKEQDDVSQENPHDPAQKTKGQPPSVEIQKNLNLNDGPAPVVNAMVGRDGVSTANRKVNTTTSPTIPSLVQPTITTEPLATQLSQSQSNPNSNLKATATPKISANFDKPTNTKKPPKPFATNNHPPTQPANQATSTTNPNPQPSNPSNQNKPTGKALYLDLASFQKTRGSVAKVKIQIDLTKERPYHVWLGYDEEQDENGDGEWLEVQYDSVPAYCFHCNSQSTINKKSRDEAGTSKNPKKEQGEIPPPAAQDQRKNQMTVEHQKVVEHQNVVVVTTEEEWQTQKKKNFKDTTQSKKQQQVYMPKQSHLQQHQIAPNATQQQAPHKVRNSNKSTCPNNLTFNSIRLLQMPLNNRHHNHLNHQVTLLSILQLHWRGVLILVLRIIPVPLSPHLFLLIVKLMEVRRIDRSYIAKQEGVPKGEGFPHVQHECAEAPLIDHRTDLPFPATTVNNSGKQQAHLSENRIVEEDSESSTSDEKTSAQMKALLKGKAKVAADFQIPVQTQKSRNKPSQKKRKAMRNRNAGISINEPPDESQFQSLTIKKSFRPDPNVTVDSSAYRNSVANPSLSQPLLPNKNPLGMVLEEFPLNRYTPKQDDYRPIESEDENFGDQDADDESSEEEQHLVYDKGKPNLRRPLWEVLRHKSTTYDSPWCVIGDFNVIATVEEKIGGIPYHMNKSLDFLCMIEDCGLADLGFYGPRCTWSNGKGQCSIVWKRLDRGLANDQWLAAFPASTISHLASTGSDHTPLLMEIRVRQDNSTKYFRFLNLWVDNANFKPFVKGIWDAKVSGSPMWIFHQKLKALSTGLSQWSRSITNMEEINDQQKKAEKSIFWRLHSGNCSFWWDNWLGIGPLADHRQEGGRPGNVTVSHFWDNVHWCLQKLNEAAPANMIHLIMHTPIFFNNNQDVAIWSPISDGRVLFSINSDINLLLRANFPEIKWPLNWQDLYPFIENLKHQTISTQVVWNKPSYGFVKVNSDGSALSNPGKIGAGVIIRDHSSKFIHAMATPLGEGTNNFAETKAAFIGIKWCLGNGFSKIHLETDALLIQWLTNGKKFPWCIKMKLQQLLDLCNSCESFICSHTYREANCPADSLSKLSHDVTTMTEFHNASALPSHIRGQFQQDYLGTRNSTPVKQLICFQSVVLASMMLIPLETYQLNKIHLLLYHHQSTTENTKKLKNKAAFSSPKEIAELLFLYMEQTWTTDAFQSVVLASQMLTLLEMLQLTQVTPPFKRPPVFSRMQLSASLKLKVFQQPAISKQEKVQATSQQQHPTHIKPPFNTQALREGHSLALGSKGRLCPLSSVSNRTMQPLSPIDWISLLTIFNLVLFVLNVKARRKIATTFIWFCQTFLGNSTLSIVVELLVYGRCSSNSIFG